MMNNINNNMLWKRHLSVYAGGNEKPKKTQHKMKQTSSLAPITSSPATNETIETNPKFLIRKKSKTLKTHKQHIPKSFFLHKGNNSQLVKEVLQSNGFVQIISKEYCSFIWYQAHEIVRKDCLKKQLINIPTNYFINHAELTDKQKLYQNLVRSNPKCVGSIIPPTYVVDFKEGLSKVQANLTQFLKDFFKKNKHLKKKAHNLSFSNFYGEVNITFAKVMKMAHDNKTKIEQEDQYLGEPMWIVKPTSLNRGKGIQIITSLKQLEKIFSEDNYQISIRMYQPEDKVTLGSYVIQEYIPNPLLYQGYKFDLRMWMLIQKHKKTGTQVYLYEEGYGRIAAHKYPGIRKVKKKEEEEYERDSYAESLSKSIEIYRKSPKKKQDGNDRFIHLTNNAVQKNCKEFGILHEGNQLSLKDLIANVNIQSLTEEYLFNQFTNIIKIMYASVKEKLISKSMDGSFQLFGLDFLLDSNLKVWLIEVNCNPSLEESSPFLKSMLREMLHDMLKVVKLTKSTEDKNKWIQLI